VGPVGQQLPGFPISALVTPLGSEDV
jgi:hypothetical protein